MKLKSATTQTTQMYFKEGTLNGYKRHQTTQAQEQLRWPMAYWPPRRQSTRWSEDDTWVPSILWLRHLPAVHIKLNIAVWMTHAANPLDNLHDLWRNRVRRHCKVYPFKDHLVASRQQQLHKFHLFGWTCKETDLYLFKWIKGDVIQIVILWQMTRTIRRSTWWQLKNKLKKI